MVVEDVSGNRLEHRMFRRAGRTTSRAPAIRSGRYASPMTGAVPALIMLLPAIGSLLFRVVQAKRTGPAAVASPWGLPAGAGLLVAGSVLLSSEPTHDSVVLQLFAAALLVIAAEELYRGGVAYGMGGRT